MQAAAADADTLDPSAYRDRLSDVRATLVAARSAPPSQRAPLVERARSLLRSTTGLHMDTGATIPVADTALASRIDDRYPSLDVAIAGVDLLISALAAPAPDMASADAQLRRLVEEDRVRTAQSSIGDLIGRWLSRWLAGIRGSPPDIRIVTALAGGLGLTALLLVVGILGRDLRERIRREVVLPEAREDRARPPREHLRAADEALRAGRARDAIHHVYLYALTQLAASEAIRYDPSLTDREVLARARSIADPDALRDLVELHARVWYGLRGPAAADAEHARSLALRAAA